MSRASPFAAPDAWPLLLSREQLCVYLGISEGTLVKVCPIPPLDLGANVLRWNRPQIDAWAASLPPRLPRGAAGGEDVVEPAPTDPVQIAADDRRETAAEKARRRAEGARCRRSPMSSASNGRTAA